MGFWSLIGLGVFGIVFFHFISSLSKRIAVLELMMLIAGAQWIIGPILEYSNDFKHFKYYMYVSENVYMSYVLPAYAAFCLGIVYIRKKTDFTFTFEIENLIPLAIIFVFLGFGSEFLLQFTPSSLKFFVFLLSNLKYIAGLIFFFSTSKKHKVYFLVIYSYLIYHALSRAMFHDFILWTAFYFMFWAYHKKVSKIKATSIFLIGFLILSMVQTIKSDYRKVIWANKDANALQIFTTLISSSWENNELNNEENQGEVNVRLNQGWIISSVMFHTPKYEPFAIGETISEAIFASILPRFLNPMKKMAGGKDNFERFTGLELGQSTSMGISTVGEAYANFGVLGAVLLMFIWGLIVSKVLNKILEIAQNDTLIIVFFIPFIYFQVVKAETEFVVVLNHLIKSSFVVFLLYRYLISKELQKIQK
jgi:hypothetical protein